VRIAPTVDFRHTGPHHPTAARSNPIELSRSQRHTRDAHKVLCRSGAIDSELDYRDVVDGTRYGLMDEGSLLVKARMIHHTLRPGPGAEA
jgi:hypothetical protein